MYKISLSVFTKRFAVLDNDLSSANKFPHAPSLPVAVALAYVWEENLKSSLELIAWREYRGTFVYCYSLDIRF